MEGGGGIYRYWRGCVRAQMCAMMTHFGTEQIAKCILHTYSRFQLNHIRVRTIAPIRCARIASIRGSQSRAMCLLASRRACKAAYTRVCVEWIYGCSAHARPCTHSFPTLTHVCAPMHHTTHTADTRTHATRDSGYVRAPAARLQYARKYRTIPRTAHTMNECFSTQSQAHYASEYYIRLS